MTAVPPHTDAPDKAYTDLITAAGHTVTRVLTAEGAPNTALLNTFDLVIIGRSQDSAFFDSAAEQLAWNTLTVPIICTSGFVTRDNRLAWNSGNTVTDMTNADFDSSGFADGNDFLIWQRFIGQNPATPVQGDADGSGTSVNAADLTRWAAAYGTDGRNIKLTVPAATVTHPIFAGVNLDSSNTMVNPFAGVAVFSGVVQRAISVNTTALNAQGTLLASIATPGMPSAAPMIYEYPSGATASNAAADVFGNKRLVFLTGSREVQGISTQTAGLMDLSADGKKMFINAVNYMTGTVATPATGAVPEPASAGLALAAAVALLAARRR